MGISRTIVFCALALSAFSAQADPLTFLEKVREMRAAGKLPGIAADGVLLPQPLLFDELKKAVNSKDAEVQDLSLDADKGTVKLLARGRVDTLLTIDFKFAEVDWEKRTLWIQYSESAASASESLLGKIFGSIAIFAFSRAAGTGPVESALAEKPYVEFKGDKIGIMLDKVPSLAGPLAIGVGKYRLFDYLGVKSIATEKGAIRVSLGFVKK